MIIHMASNFHMQAESTGTSSGRRTDQSNAVNLFKSENDNMNSSELAVTRRNISENMDNRLISSKFTDTLSDVKTAHKMVEHSHDFNSHCPSSFIKFQLKEGVSVITAQMLTDEGRNSDNQETHSEFGAEDVQILKCNGSNIQRSWSAELSTKDNESNSIHKISKNNKKENHASNITGNIKSNEEFLHLPVGSTQQKTTAILETPCKTAKVMSDDGRSNDIQETDTGCTSEYLQALTRSENKIKKSWNAEINTDKNKSNSTQMFPNNIKENHACNSTKTMNNIENFGLPTGSAQQSKTETLEELPKAVQSWLRSRTGTNLMACKITPPEKSLRWSDFSAIIMNPTISFPPEKMSTLTASNENTGSLTDVETQATSTGNSSASLLTQLQKPSVRTTVLNMTTNSISNLCDPTKVSSSLLCSVASTGPLMTSTISDITSSAMAHDYTTKSRCSFITTDCSSPDTISTENSSAVASSSFQNSEQQMERLSEYSAPLATEYQQNFIPVSNNIYNTHATYYPHEPISRILYNDQYFSSYQNNKEEQCTAKYENIITTSCSSPDTISTENSSAVASSSFQNSEQQMERLSEYSAPLATEYQQNFIPVSDNIYNTYAAYYPHEPISRILYNDQYFSSYQNIKEEQCTAKYENIITTGCSSPNTTLTKNNTAVARSSFGNSEKQVKRLSEYSALLGTEYKKNFVPVSDNIHNIYTPYYPQEPSGLLYNDHRFSSHQNNEGEQCTGKYENTSTWSDINKFNRDQEFSLDEVRRHADQQNEYYEENIVQNGHQNLVNETDANYYAYQLQCKSAKLNNEDLQQVEAYHNMDALRCTYNCCRSNQPLSTQNSAICQQSSEILKLDEIQNYKLSSTEINSFAGVHQRTVAINENIRNQQTINNPEYANVLPNTEMFQEGLHWQNLDSYSNHNTATIQEIYVNNEESIAHKCERHRTSGFLGLPYDDRIKLPIDSNSLFKSEGKFPQPSSQSTENFRLKEVVHLPDDRKVMQKGSKKKCAKKQRRSRRQQKGKSKLDKPYVCLECGKSERYNVLLKRHIELHHGNSSTHK